MTALIGELAARSSDFRKRWAKHNVHRHMRGRKAINHPEVGRLDLEYSDLALPGDPNTVITTYTATPGSASADGLALLGSWARTQEKQAAFDPDAETERPEPSARRSSSDDH